MTKLNGAVVVITGASSGVGRATALEFARAGANVVLASRAEYSLNEIAAECALAGVTALAIPTDTTDAGQVERLCRVALEELGKIDVWVNNASVYMMGRIEDVPAEEQRRLFDVNVMGYIHGIQAVMPHFRERNQGVLIQVASAAAKVPYALAGTYCASKHAVRALSVALRQELRYTDIEVSTIFPASIDTPLFQHAANYTGRALQPMPPVYDAERIARAIVKAARRPRREVVVGSAPRMMTLMRTLFPALAERAFPKQVFTQHLKDDAAQATEGILHRPLPPERITGGWKDGRRRRALPVLGALALLVPAVAYGARRLLAARA